MTDQERTAVLCKMWDHWARTCVEFFNLNMLGWDDIEICGQDILEGLIHQEKGIVFFSGHLGNFQIISLAMKMLGHPGTQIYRQANNPLVDREMRTLQMHACKRVIAKNENSGKAFLEAIIRKEPIFLLIDQKFAQGIVLPFMGHPAYTVTAPARLCQKFNSLFVPVRAERILYLKSPSASASTLGSRFRITFCEPLSLEGQPQDIIERANRLLESWIRDTL